MWARIKQAARKAWAWLKRSWSWLRWVLGLLIVVLVWKRIRARLSSLVDWVSSPTSWARIPGVENHVVAKNPKTGKMETVELPQGVKADQVAAVGVSEISGAYHVEPLHTPRDRRNMLRGER